MEISFAGHATTLEENGLLFSVLQAAQEQLGTSKNYFYNERGWEGYSTLQDAVDDQRQRVQEAAETEARAGNLSELGIDINALLESIGDYAAGELWEAIPEGADDRVIETGADGRRIIKITVAELEKRWSPITRDEWGFGADEAGDGEVIQFQESEIESGVFRPKRLDNYGNWQTVDNTEFNERLESLD